MAGILLSLQGLFIALLGPVALAAALMGALITHTFLDIVPTTFLGVPDADTAISVLPAHALCLEGHAEEAVRIAAQGSAAAIIAGIPLSLLFFMVLPLLQPLIDWWIGILLIFIAGMLVIRAEAPGFSLAIFLAAGLLGLFTFQYSFLAWHAMGSSGILMPLLSGLFGLSVLLTASQGPLPEQSYQGLDLDSKTIVRGGILGTCAGSMVGWLPGLSTATANGVLSVLIGYDHDRRAYLFATSAANTANALTGLAALYAMGRMRNGVMVALASLKMPPFTALLAAATLAAFLAYLLTIWCSRRASWFNHRNARRINQVVISFIVLLSFVLTGPFGILILLLATMLGLVPHLLNIPRVTCMGAVMVPVILFSLGLSTI